MENNKRSQFSGKIGYVLAVAGSAVGLGNIWRFPYLAAKYGGGIFLFIYFIFMLTFGYTLIMTETALGRKTKKSPVGAFRYFTDKKPYRIGGWINAIVPMLIVPYYCVIGGWVLKYAVEYIIGNQNIVVKANYFTSFIQNQSTSVLVYFILFSFLTFFVILAGVEKGIEKMSKIMMPILILLAIFVAIYSVLTPGALKGVAYLFIPNFKDFSWKTIVAAMGQMFYSLSIAMGILYTYGSYIDKDIDLEKSTSQVEIFDTLIAVLAGLMIIPPVFSFFNGDINTLQAGPSLTFITLPKVFHSMHLGQMVGIAFFVMFFFAALTSSISLLETSVSTISDEFHLSRFKSCLVMIVVMILIGGLSALGYGLLKEVKPLGMNFLDFFDFITNSIMMPLAALATIFLVNNVIGYSVLDEEIMQSSQFKRRKLHHFFMKYLAPIFITIILITSILNVLGIITL